MAHPKRAEIKSDKDGSPVTVDRRNDDTIVVTWVCGATRTFSPPQLRFAIEQFELASSYGDGVVVWFEGEDGARNRYACKLVDGRFCADDSISLEQHSVPWSTFKRALVARAKDA